MPRRAYWKRKHRMEIMRIVIQESGDAGISPMQIYAKMATGVQYNAVAKVVKVLYSDGFLKRCRSFKDTRVYKYRSTDKGYKAYLKPAERPNLQKMVARLDLSEVK